MTFGPAVRLRGDRGLPSFIREKMQSSDEFKGRIADAENMAGGPRAIRPARVGAELAADEDITVEEEPAV
jgi:hypothetical protein